MVVEVVVVVMVYSSPCITLTSAKRRLRALCSTEWIRRGRNSSIERNANTRERTNVVESETNVARKPRSISCTRLYSPAVRTSTLSRMDSKRVVGRYPCIMIISHLDTLNPAPCHRPVASCTIFFCLALFHPPRRQFPMPRPPPTFTASFLPSSDPTSSVNPSPTVFHLLSEIEKSLASKGTNSSLLLLHSRFEKLDSPASTSTCFRYLYGWTKRQLFIHCVAIVYRSPVAPLPKD